MASGAKKRGVDELTIDELARKVGMTVRNVRAYASRGLLPPPRMVGRTGLYASQHVARLTLIREMLAEGYTLAAVERILAQAPADASVATLALHHALVTPWQPEEPEELTVAELSEQTGVAVDDPLIDKLIDMGIIERVGEGRVRANRPMLLRIGMRAVHVGIPLRAVLETYQQAKQHTREIARLYVDMFVRTVWRDFVGAGAPRDRWPQIQQSIENLQPLAAQALLMTFRTAMVEAIDNAVGAELAALREQSTAQAGAAEDPASSSGRLEASLSGA